LVKQRRNASVGYPPAKRGPEARGESLVKSHWTELKKRRSNSLISVNSFKEMHAKKKKVKKD